MKKVMFGISLIVFCAMVIQFSVDFVQTIIVMHEYKKPWNSEFGICVIQMLILKSIIVSSSVLLFFQSWIKIALVFAIVILSNIMRFALEMGYGTILIQTVFVAILMSFSVIQMFVGSRSRGNELVT